MPAPLFSIPNIRWFIAFRVLFNSRFYYPVFTILFLDFGLTVAQFSLLNAIWAGTIVLAEVPSGALADMVGRKKLLNFAAGVMILEVGLISFMPRINPGVVFFVFLINRVLSGLAEAAASGADEALAYDALKAAGKEEQWGRVLELLMRFQSAGFVVAMSLGAALYDPGLVGAAAGFLELDWAPEQSVTMRFPLYLTFILAVFAFFSTLKMQETPAMAGQEIRPEPLTPRQTLGHTFRAFAWILKTPFVFTVMLFGMLFDGVIRMVITLNSQYYRMIEIPESVFGLIGSGMALLGMVVPKIARPMAENRPPSHALFLTAAMAGTGLLAMNFFWPVAGLLPALVTFSAMYFNGFFTSFYINRKTDSAQRATVLSFKGLSYNVSYGLLGIVYALGLKMKSRAMARDSGLPPGALENQVFMDTFYWFAAFFVAGFVLLLVVAFMVKYASAFAQKD